VLGASLVPRGDVVQILQISGVKSGVIWSASEVSVTSLVPNLPINVWGVFHSWSCRIDNLKSASASC
jgi:hypothetical protein